MGVCRTFASGRLGPLERVTFVHIGSTAGWRNAGTVVQVTEVTLFVRGSDHAWCQCHTTFLLRHCGQVSQSVCHLQAFPAKSNVCTFQELPFGVGSLLANIKLGRKFVPVINSMAYWSIASLTKIRSSVTLTPVVVLFLSRLAFRRTVPPEVTSPPSLSSALNHCRCNVVLLLPALLLMPR